jgi:hypothetical protein
MTTIDKVLTQTCQHLKSLNGKILPRDKRILTSLGNQLDQGNFLTENQGKLLTKLLTENIQVLSTVVEDIDYALTANRWSQPFRVIHRVRKIYISPTTPDTIIIEFTFDKRIKTKLSSLNGKLNGSLSSTGPRNYCVSLTEKNISLLVNEFAKDDFEIDQKILNFYHEISEILKINNSAYSVFQLENEKLKKQIENDVGCISSENLLLLQDRKFRYQYKITEKITENSLKSSIANRTSTKVFVNAKTFSFNELVSALFELKRLPILIIFDGHDSIVSKKCLDLVVEAAKTNGLDDQVGIYFRFGSTADSAHFNSTISELEFNKHLSDTTKIAGISNSKLPKFMVNSEWRAGSVISFTNNFKNNKSYVYCSDVDLIVYYSDKKPLNGDINDIV